MGPHPGPPPGPAHARLRPSSPGRPEPSYTAALLRWHLALKPVQSPCPPCLQHLDPAFVRSHPDPREPLSAGSRLPHTPRPAGCSTEESRSQSGGLAKDHGPGLGQASARGRGVPGDGVPEDRRSVVPAPLLVWVCGHFTLAAGGRERGAEKVVWARAVPHCLVPEPNMSSVQVTNALEPWGTPHGTQMSGDAVWLPDAGPRRSWNPSPGWSSPGAAHPLVSQVGDRHQKES